MADDEAPPWTQRVRARASELLDEALLGAPPATCQHCLADPAHTPLGPDPDKRCPVCGAAYTGPRRTAEYGALLAAGLVARGD